MRSSNIVNANWFPVQHAGVLGATRSTENRSKRQVTRTTAESNFGLKFDLVSLHVRHSAIVDLT